MATAACSFRSDGKTFARVDAGQPTIKINRLELGNLIAGRITCSAGAGTFVFAISVSDLDGRSL